MRVADNDDDGYDVMVMDLDNHIAANLALHWIIGDD